MGLSCLLLAAACSEDAPVGPAGGETVELKATYEQLPGTDARLWPQDARMNINGAEYAVTGGAGTPEAVIGGVLKADAYRAAWPALPGIAFRGDVLEFTLPAEQPYVGNDNPGLFAGAAAQEGGIELFPLCGTLTFRFYGTGRIATVGLRAEGGEAISGPATAQLLPGRAPVLRMDGQGAGTLFLNSDDGVELGSAPVDFRLYLPAGAYESGFTMIVLDDADNQMNLSVPGPIDLQRGLDVAFEPVRFNPDQVVTDRMTLRLEPSTGPADRPDALWLENDRVTINGETFPIGAGAGTREAVVDEVRQTRTFWASYPVSDRITYSDGKFRMSLPRTQTFNAATPYCGPMAAFGTGSPLELKYLCGLLRLSLTGEGTLYELKLTGKGIVGEATADGGEAGIGVLLVAEAGRGELTVRLAGDGLALSREPATVYCVLPPGSYADLLLCATDVDGKTVETTLAGPLAISRGAVTECAALDLSFVGVGDDAIDLSAEGAANCYIVTGPGRYSFATRKVGGAQVESIAAADWIWATRSEGSEANELVSGIAYADGRITFTASTRKGNAVIAALDGDGGVLWSWHLWLTDDPRNDEMRYKCGMTLLDRNLGAVSAVPGSAGSAGVLYQWGRKDPFVGGDGEEDIYSGGTQWTLAREETVMNAGYEWQTSYLGGERSMAYATAHPTELLADQAGTTWTAASDNGLWGAAKTDYDPCPPGYRVPEIDFGAEFTSGWEAEPGISDLYLSGHTYGVVYTNGDREHFWPFAGQRWGDSDRGCYTNFNFVGCYWTITFADNDNPLNFNIVDNYLIWRMGDDRWNTCHALSVRCCKQ